MTVLLNIRYLSLSGLCDEKESKFRVTGVSKYFLSEN